MDSAENLSIIPANLSLQFPFNLTFDEYIFDNSAVRFGLYVVYSIVFCLCFFGNLAVVVVLTCHRRMRNVTKFCMGNLAFANLCVAVFCIYQNLSTFLQENWIFGRFLCKMYHFTNSLSHTASILILVVICGERYLSIAHPLRCRGMLTIQRLRLTIVGVWILSGLISSPRLFYITTFEIPIPIDPDGHHDEICAPKRTLYDSHTADMIYFVLLFLLPLLVMSVLYTKIASIIWQSSAVLQQEPVTTTVTVTTRSNREGKVGFHSSFVELTSLVPRNSLAPEELTAVQEPANLSTVKDERRGQVLQSRQAAIRILIIIVITFALCNFPYHLRKICQYYMANYILWSSFNQFLTPFTFLLMYTNCALNPVIYFFRSKDFRYSVRDLLQFRLTRPQP